MTTTTSPIGIGVGVRDLQSAANREVQRLLKESKGDRATAVAALLTHIHKLGYINDTDLKYLTTITHKGFQAAAGKTPAAQSYFEVRRIYDDMLASGSSSPAALAFASASVGSYETVTNEGSETTVVYKKSNRNWQDTLTAAGVAVGGAFGQPVLGGVIGGVAGKIVDECID